MIARTRPDGKTEILMEFHELRLFEGMLMYFSLAVPNAVTNHIANEMRKAMNGGLLSLAIEVAHPDVAKKANELMAELTKKYYGEKLAPQVPPIEIPSPAVKSVHPEPPKGGVTPKIDGKRADIKSPALAAPYGDQSKWQPKTPRGERRGEREHGKKPHHHPKPPANDLMANKLRDAGVAPKKEDKPNG